MLVVHVVLFVLVEEVAGITSASEDEVEPLFEVFLNSLETNKLTLVSIQRDKLVGPRCEDPVA